MAMGIRDALPDILRRGSPLRHIECRECGTNLTTDAEECPECGGGIAVYKLS
jgi:ribosomal protein L37E